MDKFHSVDKYTLSELQWYIMNTYPNIRHSVYYELEKNSFLEIKDEYEDEFFERAYIGIDNCIKADLELKKQNFDVDFPDRMLAAATCLALIDLVA